LPLQQLSHHAGRKVRLKLRPASAQNAIVNLLRKPAGCLKERRLAETNPGLDGNDAIAPIQKLANRSEFVLALD
jgi:hypothetical protein